MDVELPESSESKFKSLVFDVQEIDSRGGRLTELLDVLRAFRQKSAGTRKDIYVAGGSVRRAFFGYNPFESDIDLFVQDRHHAEVLTHDLIHFSDFEVVYKNDTNTTLRGVVEVPVDEETCFETPVTVQVVHHRYFQTCDELLDSFDFTICQFAMEIVSPWSESATTWKPQVRVNPLSLYDAPRKRLVLHEVTYGLSTLRRMFKYAKQGYYACGGCLGDFLERIVDTPEVIHSDFEYID